MAVSFSRQDRGEGRGKRKSPDPLNGFKEILVEFMNTKEQLIQEIEQAQSLIARGTEFILRVR